MMSRTPRWSLEARCGDRALIRRYVSPVSGVPSMFGVWRTLDATPMTGMRTRAKTGARDIRTLLTGIFLLVGLVPAIARAEPDPTMLGRAIDAVVQLSIVVRGVVDG